MDGLREAIVIIRVNFYLVTHDEELLFDVSIYENKDEDVTHQYLSGANLDILDQYGFSNDDCYLCSTKDMLDTFVDTDYLVYVFSRLPDWTSMSKEIKDRWIRTMKLLEKYDKRVSREVITQVIAINNEYKKQIEELTSLMKNW